MRIHVEHDHAGEIHAVAIAAAAGGLTMRLRPRAGREVHEVEAAHVEHPTDWRNLARTRREFRLAREAGGVRLVAKAKGERGSRDAGGGK